MGLRDRLKQREEKREAAKNGGNGNLPEGVTRYIRLGRELKDGKDLVILRDPSLWFFYYVHEDSQYNPAGPPEVFVKKHTCLHSPRKAPESEKDFDEMFDKYAKPNGDVCISDKAKAKRNLYFIVPVYDPEYGEWRVMDLKEFHVNNLLDDIDKIEKSARKFNKGYSATGDLLTFSKADKTYTVSMSDTDEDEAEKIIKASKEIDQAQVDYEELANFRDEDELVLILHDADDNKVDKSVLPEPPKGDDGDNGKADESAEPIGEDESDDGDMAF